MRKSLLQRVLHGESLRPPPVWLMRQAGRYLPEYRKVRDRAGSFLDLCLNPELAAEVTLQPIDRFGFDAAIVFADILLVPMALGQRLEFREGEGPWLEPLTQADDLAAMRQRLEDGPAWQALAPVAETVGRVRTALAPETALIGFCGSPWTVATYMVQGASQPDQAQARRMAYEQPEWFAQLIDLLVDCSAGYLARQIAAGADTVQLFDTWAGVLPAAEFERWVIAPTRRIVETLKAKHPDVPVIGFPRGAGAGYVRYARETGVDAVGADYTLAPDWVRDELQARLPVQGLLDPVLLAAGGPELDRSVDGILEVLGDGPLVFNLGHGILPQTPLAHVERLLARVRGS